MKALILCAGLGTRLKPITNNIPKPMVEVNGKPVLEHLIDHINKYDKECEIIVNTHYKPETIYKYFGDRLTYFYEPVLLGDWVTTSKFVDMIGDELLVMNGDTLTDININIMVGYARSRKISVASFENMTYTGTAFFNKDYKENLQIQDFGCYWQDVGTADGLKKARETWQKNS